MTVNINKSKTMIFNKNGRLIKDSFNINGKELEAVQRFCYLGFELKASGTINDAIDNLFDKSKKAMGPILNIISKFQLPVKTSLKLFHTYITPIMLYNVEKWAILSNKKLLNCSLDTFLIDSNETKANLLHRKFLKFVLGLNKSCPTLSLMGETGEIPLIFKGYRLMIKYWYRINNLPGDTLVKKALLENIEIRTNWILTVEKLLGCFKLTDSLNSLDILDRSIKSNMQKCYVKFWESKIKSSLGRLEYYKTVKINLTRERYLDELNFEERKNISKLRCSDHELEINKGRHKNIPREQRLCKLCSEEAVENEEHFLFKCSFYNSIKIDPDFLTPETIFKNENIHKLAKYLTAAFQKRKHKLEEQST